MYNRNHGIEETPEIEKKYSTTYTRGLQYQ